jgi:hypothetical protein
MEKTLEQARAERDAAIDQVAENRDAAWRGAALAAVRELAAERDTLVSDDVWYRLQEREIAPPKEPRGMAAVMRNAEREGLIRKAHRYQPSARRHASPVLVYECLLGKVVGPAATTSGSTPRSGDAGPGVPSVTMKQVEGLTEAQWSESLGGKLQMVAWTRRRFKRMVRLLTEGRVYDDPQDDGRRKESKADE